MAKFITNSFAKNLETAKKDYWYLRENQKTKPELWEIKPDKHGNRYVVLTRRSCRGRAPNLTFLKRIKMPLE